VGVTRRPGTADPAPAPRIPRAVRARLGYLLGVLLVAAGLGWQIGWGWGAVALGAGLVALFVWLYPVDDPADDDDLPGDSEGNTW
jgi:hypothetical protein